MINQDSYSDKFITAVWNFIRQKKNSDFLPDIINKGLLPFLEFPNAKYVSLYLLDETSFELYHRSTIPYLFKPEAENIVKSNPVVSNIGKIFSTENASENLSGRGEKFNYFIFPLLTTNAPIGIIIFGIEKIPEFDITDLLKICRIFSSYLALLIDNSNLKKSLSNIKSLTEQKVAMKTIGIIKSKRELQTILNCVQSGIFVVNARSGLIISTNPFASYITGYSQSELIGKNLNELFPESKLSIDSKNELQIRPGNYDSEIKNSMGQFTPVLRHSTKIMLGNQEMIVESFIDISERKNSENALKQTKELLEIKVKERTEDLLIIVSKLKEEIAEKEKAKSEIESMLYKEKELNEMKSRFVTTVSHEFRSPLTKIRSAAQMIEKFGDKLNIDEQKDYLKRIIDVVDYMTTLLDDVTFSADYGRFASKINLKPMEIDVFLKTFINEINSTSLEGQIISMKTECKFVEPLISYGHLKKILTVLVNFLRYFDNNNPLQLYCNCSNFNVTLLVVARKLFIDENEDKSLFNLIRNGLVSYEEHKDFTFKQLVLEFISINELFESSAGSVNISSDKKEGTIFSISFPCRYLKGEL